MKMNKEVIAVVTVLIVFCVVLGFSTYVLTDTLGEILIEENIKEGYGEVWDFIRRVTAED